MNMELLRFVCLFTINGAIYIVYCILERHQIKIFAGIHIPVDWA